MTDDAGVELIAAPELIELGATRSLDTWFELTGVEKVDMTARHSVEVRYTTTCKRQRGVGLVAKRTL